MIWYQLIPLVYVCLGDIAEKNDAEGGEKPKEKKEKKPAKKKDKKNENKLKATQNEEVEQSE